MATDWSGSLQSSLTLTKCWCLTVSPCASLPEQSIELAFNPPQGCLRDRVVACVVRLMISEPPKEEARFFFWFLQDTDRGVTVAMPALYSRE